MHPFDRDDRHALGDATRRRVLGGASRLEVALWLVVLGAGVLDLATTIYGLSAGFVEQNTVVRRAVGRFGLVVLPVFKTGAVAVALGCRRLCPAYGAVVPLGLAVPWLLAAGINLVVVTSV